MSLADLAPDLGGEVADHLRWMIAERETRCEWTSSIRPTARCLLLIRKRFDNGRSVDFQITDTMGTHSTVLSDAEADVRLPPAWTEDDKLDAWILARDATTADDLVRRLGHDPAAILPPCELQDGGRWAKE